MAGRAGTLRHRRDHASPEPVLSKKFQTSKGEEKGSSLGKACTGAVQCAVVGVRQKAWEENVRLSKE